MTQSVKLFLLLFLFAKALFADDLSEHWRIKSPHQLSPFNGYNVLTNKLEEEQCLVPGAPETKQFLFEMAEVVTSPAFRGKFADTVSNLMLASAFEGNAENVVQSLLGSLDKSDFYANWEAPFDGNQGLLTLAAAATQLKPGLSSKHRELVQKINGKFKKSLNAFGDLDGWIQYKAQAVLKKNFDAQKKAEVEIQKIVQHALGSQKTQKYFQWADAISSLYPLAKSGQLDSSLLQVLTQIPNPESAQIIATVVENSQNKEKLVQELVTPYLALAKQKGENYFRAKVYRPLARFLDSKTISDLEEMVSPLLDGKPIDLDSLSLLQIVNQISENPKSKEIAERVLTRIAAQYKVPVARIMDLFKGARVALKSNIIKFEGEAETIEETRRARQEFLKKAAHLGLDIGGLFDPTGICNGVHGCFYLCEGKYWDASFSFLAMAPMLGKTVNFAKMGKHMNQLAKLVDLSSRLQTNLNKLSHIQKELERIDMILGVVTDTAQSLHEKDLSNLEQWLDPQKAEQLASLVIPRYKMNGSRTLQNVKKVLEVSSDFSEEFNRAKCERPSLDKYLSSCQKEQPKWLRALIELRKAIRRPLNRLNHIPNLMASDPIERVKANRIVLAPLGEDRTEEEKDASLASEFAETTIQSLKLKEEELKQFRALLKNRLENKVGPSGYTHYPTRQEILFFAFQSLGNRE